MKLEISDAVREKLAIKHNVTELDIIECFSDHSTKFLLDPRAKHKTNPPTQWFIGTTDHGRRLKVIFMFKDKQVIIKSAFPPDAEEERIYAKYAAN